MEKKKQKTLTGEILKKGYFLDFLTGKRVADTPENRVRQQVEKELVTKYKYPKNRGDIEAPVPSRLRKPPLRADLVIFEDDEHKIPYLVVETKSPKKEDGVEQGFGYAIPLGAKYVLWTNGRERSAYAVNLRKPLERKEIVDIPIKYGKVPKFLYGRGKPYFPLEKVLSAKDFENIMKSCHDILRDIEHYRPDEAFAEMSKLLYTKMFDEKNTRMGKSYKFQIATEGGIKEEPNKTGDRIKELYKMAREKEPNVYKTDLKIKEDITIAKIVEKMQKWSLVKTDLDVKGRAYEKFLGVVFRGPLGQYFTPRTIARFMVQMVDPTEYDKIADPACGSGGFLVYSLDHVREKIEHNYEGDDRLIDEKQYYFANENIFGVEVNEQIATVAMSTMIISEDSHSNIEVNDGLTNWSEYRSIKPNFFDIALTNPPFGATERRSHILKRFELGSKTKPRKNQRLELLFIERCLDLLEPHGRMGIVLPDGVLTNASLQYVRDFIDRKAKILAVISLPSFAFMPVGSGVKASLLFLEKKREEEIGDYKIFMAHADHIGYDATGKPDKNEFSQILKEYRKFRHELENYEGVE